MADKFEVSGVEDETAHPLNLLSLLERVAGIINEVQACQQRMEERQLELESNVKTIQVEVLKLAKDHTTTSSTVDKLLEKTCKVGANIKDVRVRLEKQNLRVKKVETTQEELLTKNKFRVVIYQGENEIPPVPAAKAPKEAGVDRAAEEPDAVEPPAELSSDEEYMSGGRRYAQSGERLKQSGERLKETIVKTVPAKLNLKKERTVAEGQEGAEGATEGAAPVPPPKGRKTSPDVTYTEVVAEGKLEGPVSELAGARRVDHGKMQFSDEGKGEGAEVPMYDMKQLS
ncbi:hypothetical protein SKAU_G00059510 [Synaphobranchus kaupii]|uniref:Uncharacterized protein n=1 Tax=Synaphobranchus kaupii TaxID=118154 RepID=A0A9Q1G533_SYNKA|nr:hypothetical protein SKAU_G00059510 [Synaphobranchus kaupii]